MQTDYRPKDNQQTNLPLTNKISGSWSRHLFSLHADLPKQCTSPILSKDDRLSSPDRFYKNASPTNLWVPFIPLDQNTSRPCLVCQSSPSHLKPILAIYKLPEPSRFYFCRRDIAGSFKPLQQLTLHFLVNLGVFNIIYRLKDVVAIY
jgi:hypothetical protein